MSLTPGAPEDRDLQHVECRLPSLVGGHRRRIAVFRAGREMCSVAWARKPSRISAPSPAICISHLCFVFLDSPADSPRRFAHSVTGTPRAREPIKYIKQCALHPGPPLISNHAPARARGRARRPTRSTPARQRRGTHDRLRMRMLHVPGQLWPCQGSSATVSWSPCESKQSRRRGWSHACSVVALLSSTQPTKQRQDESNRGAQRPPCWCVSRRATRGAHKTLAR